MFRRSNGILAILAAAALLCAPRANSLNLLSNPGFESPYSGGTASGWFENNWGGAAFTPSQDTTNHHGGASSQSISCTAFPTGGGLLIGQNYNFVQGHTYKASIWLRSTSGTPIWFMIRDQGAPYQSYGCVYVWPSSTWKQYTINAGFTANVAGALMVCFDGSGAMGLDDASLTDTTTAYNTTVATTAAIPANFFGIHLNHYGEYSSLPSINPRMLRLWDCGCRWNEIQPTNGTTWNWTYSDKLVNAARAVGGDVIYTMGMTPQWASARPNENGTYGLGSNSEPINISDPNGPWRTYVRAFAQRYKGQVKYYELWNETDYMFSGSVPAMVTMAQWAYYEIKAVDPANVVMNPNITINGFPFLSKYMGDGGWQYTNAISFHRYFGMNPETNDLPWLTGMKDLVNNYSLGSLPMYDTEGCSPGGGTQDQKNGALARAFITLWAFGICNYNWYGWDILERLSLTNDITPNAEGTAYQMLQWWLSGNQMVSKTVNGNVWMVKITGSGGYIGYIVWNTGGTSSYTVPSGVVQYRTLNATAVWIGPGQVTIGQAPIILDNQHR